jgi:arginyl-tRNA synthetase
MLGHPREAVEVLIYQLVHLTRGGEAAAMSKRRGEVVFLDDFVDEIGIDAARWYLLSRGHDQPIEIDVDLAAERSQKNPVYYVQYAHARIAGILRNAEGRQPDPRPSAPLAPEERELVKRLLEFPALVVTAAERRAPHAIPTYSIRVADDFHRFYHEHRVLGADEQAFRLALCSATQLVVRRCLYLIGVDAPEQM